MIALRTINPYRAINTYYRPQPNRVCCPRTDLLENADSYLLTIDLPGFDKEDLDIQATSEYIVIKAVRKVKEEKVNEETENKDKEQNSDNGFEISRKVNFPVRVTPSKAKIGLENGVLSIDIPKSEEAKAIKLYPN